MSVALIERAAVHASRPAVIDGRGEHTYAALLRASAAAARALLAGRPDLAEARVAYMVTPGIEHVAVQWGIWRAGGIAVPLSPSHPAPELDYVLEDSGAEVVVADAEHEDRLRRLAAKHAARLVRTDDAVCERERRETGREALPSVSAERRAMILYTSGTTSRAKGVVTTHANLRAQVESLVEAWEWSADDRILHVLPLHHTHGIVNVLLCALWAGAACEMHPGFDARRVWSRLVEGGITLFMAVPTIYAKLIAAWEQAAPEERDRMTRACRRLRLMVSGSAALPVVTFERWREIGGHELLERYGMTEIGMALSNPLHGERRPGSVGTPLPTVEVKLVDEDGEVRSAGRPGEIFVRGPTVFREYWRRPEATREAFCDGWFRTGDVAVVEDGYYRILGRSSVDIIKTGGYKVSALEIEEALRAHPSVRDCAVVGLDDPEWGERVAAAVVPASSGRAPDAPAPAAAPSATLAAVTSLPDGPPADAQSPEAPSPEALREWLAARLAPYKVPRLWVLVDDLPRNAMGKVVKGEVKEMMKKREVRSAK